MKKSRSVIAGIALLASTSLALAGCGGDDSPAGGSDDGGGDGGELTDVSLMLNWYPYGEHAPFYYGVEQGIFEDHGINLDIQAGQGSTKTAQAVGQGQVDFGWSDGPAVMATIDSGMDIRSVGVFLQTTPSAVQVFTDSGIETPEDLVGTTIAVSEGDAPTTTFPLYLDAVGLSEDDVTQQNSDPAGKIAAMLSGQVDGLIGFAHDQGPTVASESGREVTYLRYSDAGLNFYSNGLVVNTDLIESDPDLIQAMVDATSEAHVAAQENPEDAVAAMEGKDPQMPEGDVLVDQWQETIKLLHTDATQGELPGVNAPEDWEQTIETLSEAGLVEGGGSVEDYFDDSFAPGN